VEAEVPVCHVQAGDTFTELEQAKLHTARY